MKIIVTYFSLLLAVVFLSAQALQYSHTHEEEEEHCAHHCDSHHKTDHEDCSLCFHIFHNHSTDLSWISFDFQPTARVLTVEPPSTVYHFATRRYAGQSLGRAPPIML